MPGSTLRAALSTALLLLPGAGADAYRVEFIANWDPTLACTPSTCISNVTPTVEAWLDTEGQADILLLGVGLAFDETQLAYDRSASSTTTYLLYTSSKAPYLIPASTCGGGPAAPTAGEGCQTLPTRPDVVEIDFLSSALSSGAGVPGSGRALLATLVFQRAGSGFGGALAAVFDPALGHTFVLGDGTTPPLFVSVTYVPEPGTALLVGLGMAALALRERSGRPRRARGRVQG